MDSFITWIGGKRLLRKTILEEFPQSSEIERYIEVFGGAGWVLFAKESHAPVEVFNDVNDNLINLYRCVKYHPEALQKEIEWSLTSREQFYEKRERMGYRGETDIQRASDYFFIIKNSYGANCRTFGLLAKDLIKASEYLSQVSLRLKKTIIENIDFERLVKLYDRTGALFYADPPYYGSEKNYTCEFSQDDHLRLHQVLSEIKGRFILSYNDCEYIRDLYKCYRIIEIERSNSLINKFKVEKYKELVIKNF